MKVKDYIKGFKKIKRKLGNCDIELELPDGSEVAIARGKIKKSVNNAETTLVFGLE